MPVTDRTAQNQRARANLRPACGSTEDHPPPPVDIQIMIVALFCIVFFLLGAILALTKYVTKLRAELSILLSA